MIRKVVHPFVFSFLFSILTINTPADSNEIGWSIFDTTATEWENITGKGTLEFAEQVVRFQVSESEQCEWRLVFEPVWIYRFQELHIQYRAKHIATATAQPILTFDAGIIPALPDFSIPITNWKDTDTWSIDSTAIIDDGEIHTLVIPIYEKINQKQIDEIRINISRNGENALLELFDFSFHNVNTKTEYNFHYENENHDTFSSLQFHTLPIDQQPLQNTFQLPEDTPAIIKVDQIPFQLEASRLALTTPFYGRGSIHIPIHRKCSELFLLLGCDLAGSDFAFRFIERNAVTKPEQVIIEKRYLDGSIERSFPYHVQTMQYEINKEPGLYTIPTDPNKLLQEIVIQEWMSYGEVHIAGVTSRSDTDVLYPIPKINMPWIQQTASWKASISTPSLTVIENTTFILDNQHYHVELSSENGLWITHISHHKNNQNILTQPSPLFSLLSSNLPTANEDFEVAAFKAEKHKIHFNLSGGTAIPLDIKLTLYIDNSDQLHSSITLHHTGLSPVSVQLRFPVIENIVLSSDIRNDYYFFPRKRTAWSSQPVRLSGEYSGEFPLQWMDVYSQESQQGLAIHTLDEQLNLKNYLLMKDGTSTRMAVEHGYFNPIQLNAGEQYTPATSAIQIHDGDWHTPLHTYKNRTQDTYTQHNELRERFLVRRDYPVGGTGILYDTDTNNYDFSSLAANTKSHFGQSDVLDLSGWYYTKQNGRIGSYENWDIDDSQSLEQNIRASKEAGNITSLSFSGYLMDQRSHVNEKQLREWQIIDASHQPKTRNEYEWYMNPFHSDWQKHLSETAMRVLDTVGADALYLDQIGFADHAKADYSGRFAFPFAHPLLGEHVLLSQMRTVMDWMDRAVAIYSEQVPVDLTARLVDGACSFGMTGTRHYESPTRLNAFRYVFPSFKIFEKIQTGIYPKAVDSSLVKLAFFHGHGMWIKGKAQSWYSRECREVIRKAQSILHKHKDAFSSHHIEPMIPTKQRGLFANRFSDHERDVITIYNAAMNTISGELISHQTKTGHVSDEWGIDGYAFQHSDDMVTIVGTLHPHEVGCFIIE